MPGSNYNGPEYGVKYVLTRGSYRVSFNDPTDTDNIGWITSIDGLDDAEVRDNGENLQEQDGGIHADRFFYGRRPINIQGVIHGHTSISQRNTNIQKLSDVSGAMRDDMTITWTPTGGLETYVAVRRQQPLRVNGSGPVKAFQLGVVSADPRIYSTAVVSQTLGAYTNLGAATTYPVYTLSGLTTSPAALQANGTTLVQFTGAIDPGFVYTVDSLKRTVVKGIRTGARRNLFPNPSFEKPTAPFYVAAGPRATAFNAFAAQPTPGSGWGSHVASFQSNGGSGQPSLIELQNPDGSGYWPMTYQAGCEIAFSMMVGTGGDTATNAMHIEVVHYDASNSIVVTDDQPIVNPTVGSWSRCKYNFNAPAPTGIKARIYVGVFNDVGETGIPYYIDGALIEIRELNYSSDGSFFPVDNVNSFWVGTADASQSFYVPSGTPTVTGSSSPAYDEVDWSNTNWGGLPAGAGTVALNTQLGGSYAKMDFHHAWI